ncbi:hypothetical protein M3Y98_00167500 [Aphelenchoides besseyi]|nr:hypothetical protein M3Y98_00167500 [Aphelenchoides besseyi]
MMPKSLRAIVMTANQERVGRWYFGGVAGACAACCTHPLDLMKVHLQTQQTGKLTLPSLAAKIYKSDGIGGFYNGLTASVLRQMTYSLTRFACYETVKNQMPADKAMPFYQKVLLAGFSGACGGIVGSPADLVNVRMQNDMKLPPEQRRNYKHAIDGVYRIATQEGVSHLFNGVTMAVGRAILMTIGQISFYDQIKQMAIQSGYMEDNIYTHLSSSFVAASMATVLTQPMDVLKTRLMNAKPGQFNGLVDCFVYTARTGPSGFFKGFFPAWINMSTLRCPNHPNAHLIEDHRAGDVVCPECGLVVGDRLVDVGTEWRSFSNERSGNDPSRVGAPENPLFNGSDLSTSMAVGYGASDGDQSLANAQRKNINSTDRQMSQAIGVIREMSERIHLPRPIQDQAAKIYKDVLDSKALRGKNNEAQAAACLYIACRKEGVPRTFKVLTLCHVSVVISDCQLQFRQLQLVLRKQLLIWIWLPVEVQSQLLLQLSTWLHKHQKDKRSAKEIGEIAGAAEVTVRQTYKLLFPRAGELFPPDFKFDTPVDQLPSS